MPNELALHGVTKIKIDGHNFQIGPEPTYVTNIRVYGPAAGPLDFIEDFKVVLFGADPIPIEMEGKRSHVMTPEHNLYVRSMGKLLRVTAIYMDDVAANNRMAKTDEAVVAVLGPFIFLAEKWDKGETMPAELP